VAFKEKKNINIRKGLKNNWPDNTISLRLLDVIDIQYRCKCGEIQITNMGNERVKRIGEAKVSRVIRTAPPTMCISSNPTNAQCSELKSYI
jgi:hypothetical protein